MAVYRYEGPVWKYDRLVADIWKAETTAPTKRKAISNFKYRFKKEEGYSREVPVVLDETCINRVDKENDE